MGSREVLFCFKVGDSISYLEMGRNSVVEAVKNDAGEKRAESTREVLEEVKGAAIPYVSRGTDVRSRANGSLAAGRVTKQRE